MENDFVPKIGITIGDINGIGPEVILKALSRSSIAKLCTPIIYGSSKHLSHCKADLGFHDWQFITIQKADQANKGKFNLINCYEGAKFEVAYGQIQKEAGLLAFKALKRATEDLKSGDIDALVTAPISKENIQSHEFTFPGHTEYLAHAFGIEEALMFLISDDLKMGVVTGHVALEEVKKKITRQQVKKKIDMMLLSLRNDFGVQKPKIAVLGLNPHAGESGLLGKEELEVISPTIEEFRKNGQLVFGPFPTDGFFATQQWLKFDAILAMYHDQGLTPFKMLSFESGVNFTAGLPAVRTSPDHGTAFDLAGKNEANPSSMLNAIFAAIDISENRRKDAEVRAGAISTVEIRKLIKFNKEKN